MLEAKHAARFFSQYAKRYHAGAFATPLEPDLQRAVQEGRLHRWASGMALEHHATPRHFCTDFTGQRRPFAPGARVLRFLGSTDGQVPCLDAFHYVYAYVEDTALIASLQAQGFTLYALHISAASELIGIYWRGPATAYSAADVATLTELPLHVPVTLQTAILGELAHLVGWRDDDPYYHHGEWSHLSLRGYKPDDPTWGVKPAEMSKAWKATHPEAARLRACDWTVLADETPALRHLIALVPWWSRFERIRLLRLTTGQLTRHTDITDRSAGTRPGQISRFHLPLTTHPDVRTHAWTLTGQALSMHWQPWHLYYLDQRKPHAVVNPSETVRIHLVVDVVTDAAVQAQIGASLPRQEAA